jgi:hypothetical protein
LFRALAGLRRIDFRHAGPTGSKQPRCIQQLAACSEYSSTENHISPKWLEFMKLALARQKKIRSIRDGVGRCLADGRISLGDSMATQGPGRYVFDPLLGTLEEMINGNAGFLFAQSEEIKGRLTQPIRDDLAANRSREAQFRLIHRSIEQGEALFQETCADLPKKTLMSIARRAPSVVLDGADLLLATLIVKYGAPAPGRSWSVAAGNERGLAVLFTPDQVWAVCSLMTIATTMNHLRNMARWLGKGGKLIIDDENALRVIMPPAVRHAVEAYDGRRVSGRLFDRAGFFSPQPDPKKWSQYRIPVFVGLGAQMIEAPAGTDRKLSFERFATMLDGGGLANLLRAYETPLQEVYGIGADSILHFLTALAVLIHNNSPGLAGADGKLAFLRGENPADTERRIGFAFDLSRKGFLRHPRADLIHNIGRVRSPVAPDQETGEAHARNFIDAFLKPFEAAGDIDALVAGEVPFLHLSTDDHIYVDLLLLHDFLGGIIENAKSWYASQHGDRFVLDLKRWLDEMVPGAVVGSRRPVGLGPQAGKGDIDLLVRDRTGLIVVECKAYAKSRLFFLGAPGEITRRRGRIRAAAAQAQRTAEAFSRDVSGGLTEFPAETPVRWLVCSPTTEFLLPLDELGMETPEIPRVLTPEELLIVLLPDVPSEAAPD